MSKVLIINGHKHYPFAEGRLNTSLAELARETLEKKGHETRVTSVEQGWDVEVELDNHQWADVVVLQTPINWMGVTWSFKKYMDDVYTAGMGGAMCNGDGRSAEHPKANYGMGGVLTNTQYMLSITANAPAEAFGNTNEPFFEGLTVDDLFRPMHLNFKFMGMKPLPTFAAHDLMKNPEMETDITRFKAHLAANF